MNDETETYITLGGGTIVIVILILTIGIFAGIGIGQDSFRKDVCKQVYTNTQSYLKCKQSNLNDIINELEIINDN